ncbi:ribosomal protein L6 [Lycorma delicatula]|uniref:ribosomal protein L6 n=1 Tax=Lycorma delicatula TaxID=130591 RepID=UPI003F51333B
MADTKKKVAAPGSKGAGKAGAKKKNPDKEKLNRRSLGSGMYKYGRRGHKISVWTFAGKRNPKKAKPKKKLFVEKPISGEKNGEKRIVSLVKKTKSYPTTDRIRKHPAKKCFKEHRRHLRSSLVPGKVVILLAGIHKGRRAIFLKQLKSGLLLITGPFTLNGVPIRRVHKSYVIATSTQIDMSKVEIPSNIDDAYFKRVKAKRAKKEDGDIFVSKKETYKASDQRKADQKVVDKLVLNAINKTKGYRLLRKYLCTMFGLRTNMYPHKMKF